MGHRRIVTNGRFDGSNGRGGAVAGRPFRASRSRWQRRWRFLGFHAQSFGPIGMAVNFLENIGTALSADAGTGARVWAASPARQVLEFFGIGINDAANGVFLPGNLAAENATGAAVPSTSSGCGAWGTSDCRTLRRRQPMSSRYWRSSTRRRRMRGRRERIRGRPQRTRRSPVRPGECARLVRGRVLALLTLPGPSAGGRGPRTCVTRRHRHLRVRPSAAQPRRPHRELRRRAAIPRPRRRTKRQSAPRLPRRTRHLRRPDGWVRR